MILPPPASATFAPLSSACSKTKLPTPWPCRSTTSASRNRKAADSRRDIGARSIPPSWGRTGKCSTSSTASKTSRDSCASNNKGSRRKKLPKSCAPTQLRSEEHTSELQSHLNLVCRLLLEKKKKTTAIKKKKQEKAHRTQNKKN